MLLTIDVGNTNLTLGLYDGNTLFAHWRLATDHARMPDEYGLQLLGLLQNAGQGEIEAWVEEVLQKMPEKVAEYRKGKKGLIGLFMGEVKKVSKGKADPKTATTLLEQKLNQQ